MKAAGSQRWDLVVGAAAAIIAIAGLLLSVSLGNTEDAGAVSIDDETQKALVVMAGVILMLVAIKAGIRH